MAAEMSASRRDWLAMRGLLNMQFVFNYVVEGISFQMFSKDRAEAVVQRRELANRGIPETQMSSIREV